MSSETPPDERPILRVVGGGEPTPEELAALVAVLAARGQPTPPVRVRSRWADRSGALRRPLPHGPGEWQASARTAAVHSA